MMDSARDFYLLGQGCQSQMDGGPNEKFRNKPRAGLIECSLKKNVMTAYSLVIPIKQTENLKIYYYMIK